MRSLLRRSVFPGLVFLCFNLSLFANDILINDESQDVKQVEYLEEGDTPITIEQVLRGEYAGQFKTSTGESSDLDTDAETFWLKFSLTNTGPIGKEYILDFHYWSHVNVFYQEQGQILEKKTGNLVPYNDRNYPNANNCFILIYVPAGKTIPVVTRLNRAFNNEIKPSNLKFTIEPRTITDARSSFITQLVYMFLGIYLVMFLYNLFIFITTKDISYRFYLVIILFSTYWILYHSGYLYTVFSGLDFFPQFNKFLWKIMTQAFGITIFLFLKDFLRVRERYPAWNKRINIFIWIYVLIAVVQLINFDIGFNLSFFFSFVLVFTVFYLALKSWREGYPSANYFFIGYFLFLLGATLTGFSLLGIIPKNIYIESFAQTAGSCMEVALFAFALANKINILRRENARSQQKIIEQLKENELLQAKVNRELEEKVAERTQEIARQKEQIEEEKEKSDQLLLNILPKSTMEELKMTGHATPRYYDQAVILFTDFKSFSRIAEQLSPNDLVRELDYCFGTFDDIIALRKLEKIKTIGDAYMCAGGVPVDNEARPQEAIEAALEMQEWVAKWNQEKIEQGLMPWELRIGIHTGPVTAGVVGKQKFAYDIWGDAVNLAARMESGGAPGRVNISGATYQIVKDDYDCTYRGEIEVKNLGKVSMYFVDAKKTSLEKVKPAHSS